MHATVAGQQSVTPVMGSQAGVHPGGAASPLCVGSSLALNAIAASEANPALCADSGCRVLGLIRFLQALDECKPEDVSGVLKQWLIILKGISWNHAQLAPNCQCTTATLGCQFPPPVQGSGRPHWGSLIQSILGTAQQVPCSPAPPQKPELVLGVISACGGIGVPLLALQKGLALVEQSDVGHMVSFRLAVCIVYECDFWANGLAQLAHDKMPCPVTVKPNVKSMSADMQQLVHGNPSVTHWVCLAGTECRDVSFANPAPLIAGKNPLRFYRSRTFFHWHCGMKALLDLVAVDRVISICELPSCKCPKAEEQMNYMVGPGTESNAQDWGCAQRRRHWRTSPQVLEKPLRRKWTEKLDQYAIDAEGWKWFPTPELQSDAQKRQEEPVPIVLRSYWPILLGKVAAGNPLSPFEVDTVNNMKLFKQESSGQWVHKFADVQFFIKHLALENTPLAQIGVVKGKCIGQAIHNASGRMLMRPADREAAVRAGPGHAPCGYKFYCPNCSANMKRLGRCWHLLQASEVIREVFHTGVPYWAGKSTSRSIFFQFECEAHACSEKCSQGDGKVDALET